MLTNSSSALRWRQNTLMTSCQNICEVEECPGGEKGLGGVIPFGNSFSGPRGALTDVTAASKWFGSKFSKVSWRDPLSPWHMFWNPHKWASCQQATLHNTATDELQANLTKQIKHFSASSHSSPHAPTSFLGSSSPFSCQCCTVKVRLCSAKLAE